VDAVETIELALRSLSRLQKPNEAVHVLARSDRGGMSLAEVLETPAGPVLRLGVLWTALTHALEVGSPRDRILDLIDYAFVDAVKTLDALEFLGFPLERPGHAAADRAKRTLRSAAAARSSLTSEDLAIIDEARLRTLR